MEAEKDGEGSAGERLLSKLEWSQLDIASETLPWTKIDAYQSVPPLLPLSMPPLSPSPHHFPLPSRTFFSHFSRYPVSLGLVP